MEFLYRTALGIGFAAVLGMSAYALVHSGIYGLALFALLPVALGALAAWVCDAQTANQAALAGFLSVAAASLLFLLFGAEGAICIVMALPIAAPLACLGAWITFQLRKERKHLRRAGILLLLPPASLAWDMNATMPLFEVRSAIEINAPPETVWQNVVSFSDLPRPQEWYFKTGLAYPQRARIEGSGAGAIRYCEFSTGPFVEPIETWDPPKLLRFSVTENPAPMEEWSPYGKVTPRHLHGYLVSEKGQFRLTRLANNRTRLEGTTWYRHGLRPVQYWRVWSDAIIHRIHLRVLNHIRVLSEEQGI